MEAAGWPDEAQAVGLTSANWLDPPYNRLGFRRVAKLVRTVPVSRGGGPVLEVPRDERDLDSFEFEHRGRSLDIATMLAETTPTGSWSCTTASFSASATST